MPKTSVASKAKTTPKTAPKKTPKSSVTKAPAKKMQVAKRTPTPKKSLIKKLFPKEDRKGVVYRSKDGSRILQIPKRIWYNPLTWRNLPPVPDYKPLPKARKMFWFAMNLIWEHKKLFGCIILIYGVLDFVLVRGLAGGTDITSIKNSLTNVFHGTGGKLTASGISFVYLLASSGSGTSGTSGFYEGVLLTVCSLAFIWAFRQVLAKHPIRMRDSFYQGMYPLIPFLLVFVLFSIQLLPLAIGGSLYSTVMSGGIAVYLWERILWLSLLILLALWSFRMITASIFALYIVTLPDMTPMRAYRSARQLVYGRRLLIWRKLIFLPFILLLLAAVIELPLILFAPALAGWAFLIVTMIAVPVVHGYLYTLYREML